MSRSAIVALVAAVLLVGAYLGLVGHEWHALHLCHEWFHVGVIVVTIYCGATAAVLIRRIAEPTLAVPWLAWIAIALIWIMSLLGDDNNSSSSSKSSWDPARGMGLGWAIFGSILALGAYAGGFAGTRWLAHDSQREVQRDRAPLPPPAPPPTPAPAPVAPPVEPPPARDLTTAIARIKPLLVGADPDVGARELAKFLAAHPNWTEVVVAKNETSLGAIVKDPHAEAGKRLCVSGTLARLDALGLDGASVRLVPHDGGPVLEAYAVGGTGKLAVKGPARLCGVATGKVVIAGKPAAFAVGMLDIPR